MNNALALRSTPKPVVEFYKGVMASNAVTPSKTEAALDVFNAKALDFKVDSW